MKQVEFNKKIKKIVSFIYLNCSEAGNYQKSHKTNLTTRQRNFCDLYKIQYGSVLLILALSLVGQSSGQ